MRFAVYKVPLDGTNETRSTLATPSKSITVLADTSSVQLLVRPSDGSDQLPLNSGGGFTFENADGSLISPCRIGLQASSAITAYIVQGLP